MNYNNSTALWMAAKDGIGLVSVRAGHVWDEADACLLARFTSTVEAEQCLQDAGFTSLGDNRWQGGRGKVTATAKAVVQHAYPKGRWL